MRGLVALSLLLGLAAAGVAYWALSTPGAGAEDPGARPALVPDPAPGGAARREPLGLVDASPGGGTGGLPQEWARRNNEAVAAIEAGDLPRAVELLEECVAALPDVAVLRGNLAEALARLARREYADADRRAAAIERLARAVEVEPARADLAALLGRWREAAEAEAGFWTDESEHFRLSYDGSRQDLLHRGYHQALTELEGAYQDFGELFGAYPVEAGEPKIDVLLYRRERFARLTGLGHWAGGVYDGRVRIPLEDLDRELPALRRTLRHELVHVFVRHVGGREVPGWLNEGLAQWLEESFLHDRAARVQAARQRLEGETLFPLSALRGSLASWDDEDAIALAYAQSLALVDHIQRWYGERLLFLLVDRCDDGAAPPETFRERTLVELDTALADLASSL